MFQAVSLSRQIHILSLHLKRRSLLSFLFLRLGCYANRFVCWFVFQAFHFRHYLISEISLSLLHSGVKDPSIFLWPILAFHLPAHQNNIDINISINTSPTQATTTTTYKQTNKAVFLHSPLGSNDQDPVLLKVVSRAFTRPWHI